MFKWMGFLMALQDFIQVLSSQQAREFGDDVLDWFENQESIQNNPKAMARINSLRDWLNIPDDIGGDED